MIEDQRRPGLLQTSKMEGFAAVVEGYIIAKFSILDFWGSPRYASVSRTEMTFQNKLKGLLENSRWATGIINTGFTKLRVARSFVIGHDYTRIWRNCSLSQHLQSPDTSTDFGSNESLCTWHKFIEARSKTDQCNSAIRKTQAALFIHGWKVIQQLNQQMNKKR